MPVTSKTMNRRSSWIRISLLLALLLSNVLSVSALRTDGAPVRTPSGTSLALAPGSELGSGQISSSGSSWAAGSADLRAVGAGPSPPATTWSFETIDSAGNPGKYSSLALDASGRPHISYYDETAGELRYAHHDGSTWITATVDGTGNVGLHGSLALDAGGNPHIGYYDAGNTALKYAYWDGADWTVSTADDTGDVGQYASLALDVTGSPHISYYRAPAPVNGGLRYARLDGSSWISTTVDGAAGVGAYTSLALQDGLLPRISYYHTLEEQLKFASWTGSVWTVVAVNEPGDGGKYTSLALDAAGRPHISFFDGWVERDLKYAHREAASWISNTVASVGASAVQTSLALDGAGLPQIAFYDDVWYALSYAHLDSATWTTESLDNTAYLAAYPSLALDSAGYPWISYYHSADGLKLARLQPCRPPEVLDVSGPQTAMLGTWNTFTATVSSPTATLPITYTWLFPGGDGSTSVQHATEQTMPIYASLAGPQVITVTAENCGGSATAAREFTVVDPVYPDLVITDLWNEAGEIWFQIANQSEVPAPAGHAIGLWIDEVGTREEEITVDLGPNETAVAAFGFVYSCTGDSDTIRVATDLGESVVEEDETNNERQESWICDQDAPMFTTGPTVTLVTDNSATLFWTTDENSDSAIQAGPIAGEYNRFEHNPIETREHEITLTGLEPSTVYHYVARSTDPNGFQSTSDTFFFETLPRTNASAPRPTLMMEAAGDRSDLFQIRAIYTNTSAIDHVTFFINGQSAGSDFSEDEGSYIGFVSPYEMGMSPDEFYGLAHTIEARTFDRRGTYRLHEALADPFHQTPETEIAITFPPPDLTIYYEGDAVPAEKRVDFLVTAKEYEWDCEWLPTDSLISKPSCADVAVAVDFVQFLVDNQVVATSYPSNENVLSHYYSLDLSDFSGTQRTVVARAVDSAGGKHEAQVTIHAQKIVHDPILKLTRVLTPQGNTFRVELTVENDASATGDATVTQIRDTVSAFQVVPPDGADYSVSTSYGYWAGTAARQTFITIDLPNQAAYLLAPGESFTVEYQLVPVLYETSADYQIGIPGQDVRVFYEDPAGVQQMRGFDRRVPLLASMVRQAIAAADYLIVTQPRNLFSHYPGQDVNGLLNTMGRLATLKDGVLGYLESANPGLALDASVEPDGSWARRLHPNFSIKGSGYMLIVGETEIVPAWNVEGFASDKAVSLSDQYYSSVGNGPPLINLGRAIGDSAASLERPLLTSIHVELGTPGYGNDRTDALLASGVGSLVDIMVTEADYVENSLQNQGLNVTKIHWKDRASLGSVARRFDQYDHLVAGDLLNGDGVDELVVAVEALDRIYLYAGNWNLLSSFPRTLEDGDALAVGDVNGDGSDEIVLGDFSSDWIYILNGNGAELAKFAVGLAPFDGLAVGDVVAGGAEEIVLADHDSRLIIFDQAGNSLWDGAHLGSADDRLAVGDVDGSSPAEIVFGRQSAQQGNQITGTVTSYVLAGQQLSQTATFKVGAYLPGSALAVGDVDGNGTDEILLGRNHGWINILNRNGGTVRVGIPSTIVPHDGLTAGRFSGGARAEIRVADQDDLLYAPDLRFIDQAYNAFAAAAPDQDLLFFIGHGNPNVWGPGLDSDPLPFYLTSSPQFPLGFGGSNPIAYGASCQTGNYERGDDYGVAEAYLDSRAAVYIGAVENSGVGPTERSLEWFYDNWLPAETIGRGWFDLERAKWNASNHRGDSWDYLIHEYNLYGDPKFGAVTGAAAADRTRRAPGVPPVQIKFEVPDYEVIQTPGGYDQVLIPGGDLDYDLGAHEIPYWTETVEITRGYRIQDVALILQTDLSIASDLHLPAVSSDIWTGANSTEKRDPVQALAPEPDQSWVPPLDQVFTWQVTENPDGTSLLIIKVFPLTYNHQTSTVRYQRTFAFAIEATVSTVGIDRLATDRAVYDPGNPVSIDLWVSNSGEPQDVIVDATIRNAVNGHPLAGLPLRNLHNLAGDSSFSIEWDSSSAPAGDYSLEVVLRDSQGDLLDRASQAFHLGILSGEVTDLSAAPEAFEIGDPVELSLTFQNSGSVPITGTVHLQVRAPDGVTAVKTISETVNALLPGRTINVTHSWDTAGAEKGDYRVLGYALYDARSSNVETVPLSTWRRVYLPAVLR